MFSSQIIFQPYLGNMWQRAAEKNRFIILCIFSTRKFSFFIQSAQRITRPIACREKQIYHVTHYFKNFLFPSSLQGSTQRIKKRTRYFRHHFQFTLQDIQQSKCLAQDISLFHVMNLFCPFTLFSSFFCRF